jgi:hypothetical protein
MPFALDDLPPAHPLTTVAFLGLAVLLWLFARVQLLRRQLEHGGAEQRGVTRIGFLHKLAAWRATNAVLAMLAVACAALLWWSVA